MTTLPCFVVKDGLTWKCDVCDRPTGGPLGFLQVCPKLTDADPESVCPKCGALVEDLDGFGVLAHLGADGCGYCSHFDVYGDECRVCGAVIAA